MVVDIQRESLVLVTENTFIECIITVLVGSRFFFGQNVYISNAKE